MRRRHGRLALAAISLLCAVLLAACGSSAPVLRGVSVTPPTATIDNNTTQQFTATAFYSNGSQQSATGATWTSSNAAVATVDANGVATALGNGTTTITASMGGFSGSAVLTVSRTLVSIAISPAAPQTVALGLTANYTAMGTFLNADGTTSTSDITTIVTWNSSNGAAATIDNTGLVTTVATGTTNISASLDGVNSPNAALTVGPAATNGLQVTPAAPSLAIGNTVALVALELNSDGTTKPLTGPVTWAIAGCTPTGSAWLASTTTNGTEIAVGNLVDTGTGCTVTATEGALTGTSTVTVVTGSAHFAYVSNAVDSTISQYAVDATSTTAPLTPLSPATLSVVQPTQVVVHPNGLYAYSTSSVSNVYLYDVATGGAGTLTLDPGAPASGWVAGSGNANYLVIDPSGRFLYVSDDGGNTIYGFTIDPATGLLTAIGAVTGYTTNLNSPEDLLVDHTGKYLYAVNFGNNTVSGYTIDQTSGALTPLTPATFATGSQPLFATISPSNASFYAVNSGDNTVTSFSLSSTTGALTTAAATPVGPGAVFALNAVVDPTNAYLYVLDTGDGTAPGAVFAYALNADGTVGAAIAGTPVATGVSPTGIIIDPTGTLLAADNNVSNTISPFSVVTTTGTPTAETAVATGNGPLFVTFLNAP
jgi:6-phosphogluconolactonase